jgi:uncharacterized integral membrane protein
MIRFLLWLIIGVPLGFVLVSLAVSSTAETTLRLWPLAYEVSAPVGLVLMAVIIVSFFAGAIAAWLLQGRTRARLRAQRRMIEDLRDEIAATHARLGQAAAAAEELPHRRLAAPSSKAA